jgi:hypothetical protein
MLACSDFMTNDSQKPNPTASGDVKKTLLA